jgi:hypothetical protein
MLASRTAALSRHQTAARPAAPTTLRPAARRPTRAAAAAPRQQWHPRPWPQRQWLLGCHAGPEAAEAEDQPELSEEEKLSQDFDYLGNKVGARGGLAHQLLVLRRCHRHAQG